MPDLRRFCSKCGQLAACVIEHPTRIGKYGEMVIESVAVCLECKTDKQN
jgi:hypothetical protein